MHHNFGIQLWILDTILKDTFKPFKIFKKGDLKIGVFGIGIELDGLVPKSLFGNTIYQDPIVKANYYASLLKHKEKCDLIICLSHLGFKYKQDKVSDIKLARESQNINLIIGGHTHTFLKNAVSIPKWWWKKILWTVIFCKRWLKKDINSVVFTKY